MRSNTNNQNPMINRNALQIPGVSNFLGIPGGRSAAMFGN